MMRETETVPDDEDDEARRSQTLLERPQRSHEESTNKYKYKPISLYPLPAASCLSFSVFLRVAGRAY
jgi:hypothetical protein